MSFDTTIFKRRRVYCFICGGACNISRCSNVVIAGKWICNECVMKRNACQETTDPLRRQEDIVTRNLVVASKNLVVSLKK